VDSVEGSAVSFLPELPRHQQNHAVEGTPKSRGHRRPCLEPPETDTRGWPGRKLLHVGSMEGVEPNFSGEDAGGEQMIDCLLSLAAQGAVRAGL